MDPIVRSAMEKWPNVPDLFGWLSLDARGQWRLRDEIIRQPKLIEFIQRNYLSDSEGRWFFQNGPQRVFVRLACTPWIVRLQADGTLQTQTGASFDARVCLIDEIGHLILAGPSGPALLDDRDLLAICQRVVNQEGRPADAEALVSDGSHIDHLRLQLDTSNIPFERICQADLPGRFHFNPAPDQPRP